MDIQWFRYTLYARFQKGNSLAVRVPAVVVEGLNLKEGDEIEIPIAGKGDFRVTRDPVARKGSRSVCVK
jgi:antitoxin component of MazEF toxin-antitoxin module